MGGGGGGGGRKVPAAHNCKTINDNEMKFVGIYRIINLLTWCGLIGIQRHHYVIMTS